MMRDQRRLGGIPLLLCCFLWLFSNLRFASSSTINVIGVETNLNSTGNNTTPALVGPVDTDDSLGGDSEGVQEEAVGATIKGHNESGNEVGHAHAISEITPVENAKEHESVAAENESAPSEHETESAHGSAIEHGMESEHGTALDTGDEHEGEHESEPAHAVLFPSFSLTLGVVVFIFLTRYCHALPFTAVMFLIGTMMGIGVELLPDVHDHVSVTTRMWSNIDAEVLLLVFLPGLIFKDSMGLNVHLFRSAFGQCLLFAFPLVLAGTILTATVASYVFPFGWGRNVAMTFGSILSATDPVAVAALLEEVGAPPRLKVHIAGEALLNDGAAIVFFTIFSYMYYHEIAEAEGIEEFGRVVDWSTGFGLFFRMSLGGALIGVAFGLSLILILWVLDRRFSREENIVEVTATAAVAYLGYYVAEVVCHTSGVIATVASGITVKFLGRASLNDAKLLDDFWVLVEHILNTILFTLGGAVWGSVIANGESHGEFTGQDWGYMFLLYILLAVIRFVLFFSVYPISSRMGLSTNPKETFFQVYGGLRGAVGIALAIALDTSVRKAAPGTAWANQTNKVFGMIGGIAFCTLVINGTTAGPLLVYFKLADSTETRKKIVSAYEAGFKQHMIARFVALLSEKRFRNVNFGLVKAHVPYIEDLTKTQIIEALERHRDTTATEDYRPPYLQGVIPYLKDDGDDSIAAVPNKDGEGMAAARSADELLSELAAEVQKFERNKRAKNRQQRRRRKSNIQHLMSGEPLSAQEMRTLFISLLRANYEQQIDRGELVDREFLAIALQQSLEFAADNIANGGVLQDWHYVHIADGPASSLLNRAKHSPGVMKLVESLGGKGAQKNIKYTIKRMKIERSMNFMAAHREAQRFVSKEFENAASELSEAARVVINESTQQYQLAEAVLHSYKRADVESVTSHKFCTILLNSGQHYISKLVKRGLLKDDEAEHWVKDIEHHLEHVLACNEESHPGELHVEYIHDEWVEGKFKDERCQGHKLHSIEAIPENAEVDPKNVKEMFKDVSSPTD